MFIQDYKQKKYLKDIHDNSLINMNDYFKYSGKVEKTVKIVSGYTYDYKTLRDKLTDIKIKNIENGRKKLHSK